MTASAAMQEYLAEAYRIASYQENDHYVSTSALAEVINVSAPAVTRMVQRLKEAGYLEHEPYKGIKLTDVGEHEALMNIRKHRMVERFMVDIMGFGWHEVHDAADELGAAASATLVTRMDQMMDFPRRCPHGEPIPDADGNMPSIVDFPLTDPTIQVGQNFVISRVHTHDEQMLKYLDSLGLTPGKAFRLLERAPFNGPLQVLVGDNVQFIGYELAGTLRISSEEAFELT